MVRDDPKLLNDVERDTQISRKRLAVQFPAVGSPLYLTTNLPRGQLPPVLQHSPVGLLSHKNILYVYK